MTKYKCVGCNVFFLCDLNLDELRACPVCVSPGTLQVCEGVITLCSDCGAVIPKDEVLTCGACLAPLCDTCGRVSDACRECDRRDTEADDALVKMPTAGRPC